MNASLAREPYNRYHLMGIMNRLKTSVMVAPFIGEQGIAPVRPLTSTKVLIDSDSGPGELPFPHGPSESVNELVWGNYEQREIDAPIWRGKYTIDEHSLNETRRVGVPGSSPTRQGDDLIMDRVIAARQGVDLRMAQATVDALKGKVKLRFANGQAKMLNYNQSPDLQIDMTAADSARPAWTNHDTADPIDDIEDAKQLLREHGAFPPDVLLMGGNVVRNIVKCESYLEFAGQTEAAVNITRAMSLPGSRFLGLRPVVASGTYPQIDKLETGYTSGMTLTLQRGTDGPFSEIAAGDTVIVGFSSAEGDANRQGTNRAKIGSIDGRTLTLTSELGRNFEAGDQVVWHRPIVGWNDVFVLPAPMPEEWLCWGVAQTLHAGYRATRYIYIHRNDDPIPAKYDVPHGVDGIPIYKRTDQHAYLKTAA